MLCQEEMEQARRDRGRGPDAEWEAAVVRVAVWEEVVVREADADAWGGAARGRAEIVSAIVAEPGARISRVRRVFP